MAGERGAFWARGPLSLYLGLRVVPIAALLLALVGWWALTTTQRELTEEVSSRLGDSAEFASRAMGYRLETIVSETRNLAANGLMVNALIDTQRRDAFLPEFFKSLKFVGPGEPRITLYDYRAREIASVANPAHVGVNIVEWREDVERGETVVSVDLEGLLIAVPVLYNGLPEGALVVDYGIDDFQALFDPGSLSVSTALVDKEGMVLRTSDPAFAELGWEMATYDAADWIVVRRDVGGIEGVSLFVAQRTDQALTIVHELRKFIGITILASLVAMLGSILLTTYLGTREVRRLSDLIREVGVSGELSKRVRLEGPRELGELGGAFNRMLEQLERTTTSRDNVDAIISSMNEILLVAAPDGSIRTRNPAASNFIARRGLQVSNHSAAIVAGGEVSESTKLDQLVSDGVFDGTLEAVYQTIDGTETVIAWSTSEIRSRSNLGAGTVLIGQDITSRFQFDEMKTDFVSSVSHELRTPLTSIKGSLDLVSGGAVGALSDQAAVMINTARRNADRLLNLINDLLDIQKIEAGRMEYSFVPVDVVAAAAHAIELNQSYADEFRVSLILRTELEAGFASLDEDRFQQILANLLSNAIKFSEPGQEVVLYVERQERGILIAVEDHGTGIPDDFRDRIFSKFAQAEAVDTRTRGGTGLGLSITQRLVRAMEGEIGFESEEGEGTTFTVIFPELPMEAGYTDEADARVAG